MEAALSVRKNYVRENVITDMPAYWAESFYDYELKKWGRCSLIRFGSGARKNLG